MANARNEHSECIKLEGLVLLLLVRDLDFVTLLSSCLLRHLDAHRRVPITSYNATGGRLLLFPDYRG